MNTVFKAGDAVRITYEGRTLEGEVLVAAPNGRSYVLGFAGLLGGYLGTIFVADGVDLICRKPVTIEALVEIPV